jgi:hypothetical protein
MWLYLVLMLFVKLKVLLHPKLKSHFQRAAILINAHFCTQKFPVNKRRPKRGLGSFSARVSCNRLRMKAALKAVSLP